jgi:hypothetical protein
MQTRAAIDSFKPRVNPEPFQRRRGRDCSALRASSLRYRCGTAVAKSAGVSLPNQFNSLRSASPEPRVSPFKQTGGEGGIRTLEHLLGCYSLSRRAPSTTRPPLRWEPDADATIQASAGRKGTGGGLSDQILQSPAEGLRSARRGTQAREAPASRCWPPCWAVPACSAAARPCRHRGARAAAEPARPSG